jgi:nitrogen fixation protein FixH
MLQRTASVWRSPLWLIGILLTACATPYVTLLREEQTVDGLLIALEANPNPQLNTNEVFIIALYDAQGRPVENADVYLDLDMPAMPMGSNQPIAEHSQNGQYRAETAYTMTGDWTIDVIVAYNGEEYRARFERVVLDS